MKKFTILMLLTGIFIGATSAYGQPPAARRNASVDPCLGGGGTGIVETIIVASLERLVGMSDLILVGTVANVLHTGCWHKNDLDFSNGRSSGAM
jgi:hypothetical protein